MARRPKTSVTSAEMRAQIGNALPADSTPSLVMDPIEARARAAFERDAGAPMTDAEWAEARTNLISFFRILAEWKRAAERKEQQ